MRILRIILVCACLAGLTQSVWGQQTQQTQQTKPTAPSGIPGYLDPRTGTFKPLANIAPPEESETEAVAASSGDFAITFNISVKSSIPSTETIACVFDAVVFGDSSGKSVTDSMTVAATRSGATATCKLKMFYSWPLASPTTDLVSLDYEIVAGEFVSPALPLRISTQTLSSIKVPALGATTTMTIAATI